MDYFETIFCLGMNWTDIAITVFAHIYSLRWFVSKQISNLVSLCYMHRPIFVHFM